MKRFKNLFNICCVCAAVISAVAFGGSVYSEAVPAASINEEQEKIYLIPCGTPFGIKMLTDGVVVTDFGCVNGKTSQRSPAEKSGVKKGDIITSVNGNSVSDSVSLSDYVQLSPKECQLEIVRDGKIIEVSCKPERSEKDGSLKLGMWTKDSCAGIGTMTFYDPETGIFGGLGHAVSEVSSGVTLPLLSGEITDVTITNVVKSSNGSPGELCGAFIPEHETGKILKNSEFGVFGSAASSPINNEAIEMAYRSEIKKGKAYIYSTIIGNTPQRYEIEIVSTDPYNCGSMRNMTIRITDPELLALTGGIVQGMSGSPIIQNDKLVGAVTHVLVNDSTMGYGIFAENMINACS